LVGLTEGVVGVQFGTMLWEVCKNVDEERVGQVLRSEVDDCWRGRLTRGGALACSFAGRLARNFVKNNLHKFKQDRPQKFSCLADLRARGFNFETPYCLIPLHVVWLAWIVSTNKTTLLTNCQYSHYLITFVLQL
jgi:hypothetical protein